VKTGLSPSLVQEAMNRLDERGRFRPRDVPDLRAGAKGAGSVLGPMDHPAHVFGPWSDLNSRAQAALRYVVESDIRSTMNLFPRGGLWTGLIRGGWNLDRILHDRSAPRRVRETVIRWTHRLSSGPLNARNRSVRSMRARRWENSSKVGPEHLLAWLGRSPHWLLGDFVEGVDVDPRARGYWMEPSRNVLYGYHVGLDLMPTPKGICCLEANLQPGVVNEFRQLLCTNPYLPGIQEIARAQGARRILWLEGLHGELPQWLISEAAGVGGRTGIPLEILEEPRMRSRLPLPSGMDPPNRWHLGLPVADNTLVFRRNSLGVGSDFLIDHKEPFIRALEAELARSGEGRVYALPMTRIPPEIPDPASPGLPNLVYKYPDSMAAMGVFFLRARDRDHALALARELDRRTGEPPGLFQLFHASRLLDGGRIFDIRAEIFISPMGTASIAAFQRESSKPIPEDRWEGVFPGKGIFSSNVNSGGVVTLPSGEAEKKLADAALAVGDAIRRILERTFRTGPARFGRPRVETPSVSRESGARELP